MTLIHQPACDTWQDHTGKAMEEDKNWAWHFNKFLDSVLESWADEQLLNDPAFFDVLDELGADTRADLDRARRITEATT